MQESSLTTNDEPKTLMSLYRYYEEWKEKLAKKILTGERLAKAEKIAVYKLITGKEPKLPLKGRPSTIERDFNLAVSYLIERERNGAKRTDKLRQTLAERYGLSDRENTFYLALNRGIDDWQSLAVWWLEHYNKGGFSDRDQDDVRINAARMEEALVLIGKYRSRRNCKKTLQNLLTARK